MMERRNSSIEEFSFAGSLEEPVSYQQQAVEPPMTYDHQYVLYVSQVLTPVLAIEYVPHIVTVQSYEPFPVYSQQVVYVPFLRPASVISYVPYYQSFPVYETVPAENNADYDPRDSSEISVTQAPEPSPLPNSVDENKSCIVVNESEKAYVVAEASAVNISNNAELSSSFTNHGLTHLLNKILSSDEFLQVRSREFEQRKTSKEVYRSALEGKLHPKKSSPEINVLDTILEDLPYPLDQPYADDSPVNGYFELLPLELERPVKPTEPRKKKRFKSMRKFFSRWFCGVKPP